MSDEVTRQMREQREDTAEELAALRQELARLRKESEDAEMWKGRAMAASSTVKQLEQSLALVTGDRDHFQDTSKRLKEQLIQVEKENVDKQAEIDNAESALAEVQSERDKWKVEAATRFNQITGLNTKVNELKEEISHLRGLRRQNDAVIKELRMLVVAGLKG
jgi:chromosome segregation ATPase